MFMEILQVLNNLSLGTLRIFSPRWVKTLEITDCHPCNYLVRHFDLFILNHISFNLVFCIKVILDKLSLINKITCQTGETNRDYCRDLTEERKIVVSDEDIKLAESLNAEQMEGFNEILDHVMTNKGKVFFVDGPGGPGKTYLCRALLARVRSTDRIAIATTTSGIAASIMPGGRTAHSRFKIPIKLEDNSVCNFTKQSGTAELLREASLIIWDEVAMT